MKHDETDDAPARHVPANRKTAVSKLRRGGRHCPICVAPFARIARKTRLEKRCRSCGAHKSHDARCRKCGKLAVWTSNGWAGCQACGLTGRAADVAVRTLQPGAATDVRSRNPTGG